MTTNQEKVSLIDLIKEEQVKARKSRDKLASDLLTTLLGEASIIGKNANRKTTDDEVVAVVRKFLKGVDETLSVLVGDENLERRVLLKTERAILNQFLPVQLSADQLTAALHANTLPKNKGALMKFFKENFPGQYDGKVAAQVVDDFLKA